jgi:hypothetical protein
VRIGESELEREYILIDGRRWEEKKEKKRGRGRSRVFCWGEEKKKGRRSRLGLVGGWVGCAGYI